VIYGNTSAANAERERLRNAITSRGAKMSGRAVVLLQRLAWIGISRNLISVGADMVASPWSLGTWLRTRRYLTVDLRQKQKWLPRTSAGVASRPTGPADLGVVNGGPGLGETQIELAGGAADRDAQL